MNKPKGELTLQTLTMPANTNAHGDIFGGWIVSQMDLAAGILAKKISQGRVVTVAINSMTFLCPVHVGEIVCCFVEPIKVGTTSMTLSVETWILPEIQNEYSKVTEGVFVFVAIDEQGKPRKVLKSQ